jgi:hypothetical protein
MSNPTPPVPPPPGGGPSFAEENAQRIASESLSHYDEASDTYHVAYGPPSPALTIRDPERELFVRVDPQSEAVLGFSIPNFKQWHADHADADGSFEVDLPPTWSLRPTLPDADGDDGDDDPDAEDE